MSRSYLVQAHALSLPPASTETARFNNIETMNPTKQRTGERRIGARISLWYARCEALRNGEPRQDPDDASLHQHVDRKFTRRRREGRFLGAQISNERADRVCETAPQLTSTNFGHTRPASTRARTGCVPETTNEAELGGFIEGKKPVAKLKPKFRDWRPSSCRASRFHRRSMRSSRRFWCVDLPEPPVVRFCLVCIDVRTC